MVGSANVTDNQSEILSDPSINTKAAENQIDEIIHTEIDPIELNNLRNKILHKWMSFF